MNTTAKYSHEPWNKGKLVGQKAPLRVRDIVHGKHVSSRAIVMQQKTQHPVQFEITEQTRTILKAWMHQAHLRAEDFLFPTRLHDSDHLSSRQYARIVKAWVSAMSGQ